MTAEAHGCRFRIGWPSDYGYIIDTWIRSKYRDQAGKWHDEKEKIKPLLTLNNTKIVVACLPDDDDAIMGWLVANSDVLQFVYVRKGVRNLGLAKQMLAVSNLSWPKRTSDTESATASSPSLKSQAT
jgi:hypothetical protein